MRVAMRENESVSPLLSKIRDYVNTPDRLDELVKDLRQWNRLTSSPDMVDDTQEGIGACFASTANDQAHPYLDTFGLLQAMFVQQDAAKTICRTVCSDFNEGDYAELDDIRELRNRTTGHPTDTKGKQSHFITQRLLARGGFHLLTVRHDGELEDEFVRLTDARSPQHAGVVRLLTTAIADMHAEDLENPPQ